MTSKEKAKELIEKFMPYMYCYMGSGMLSNDYNEKVAIDNAKKCALITVDEIIKVCPYLDSSNRVDLNELDAPIEQYVSFWEEVQIEIQRFKLEDCGC